MSHLSKVFTETPVQIPNKSGHDMSFENMLTQNCGTLTPLLCEELIPGDKISLGYLAQVKLPPLATNFYGRVDYRVEACCCRDVKLQNLKGIHNFAASSNSGDHLDKAVLPAINQLSEISISFYFLHPLAELKIHENKHEKKVAHIK